MKAKPPITIKLNPDGSVTDQDDEIWYTRESYLEKLGLSKKSVQVPYHHVLTGKAACADFLTIKLFKPL